MDYKIENPNKPVNSEIFYKETGFNLHFRDGEFWICGDCTKAQAEAALAAHNPEA